MRHSIVTSALGILFAASGCAVEVMDEEPADQQSGALTGAASAAGATRTRPGDVVLKRGGFVVEQLEFVDEGGMSAWGSLSIDPVAVAREAGFEAGFVSVRTALGWVVHNLPIQSRPERDWPARVVRAGAAPPAFVPPVKTYFNLGTAKPIRSTEMLVVFTPEPLSTASALRRWESAPLSVVEVKPTQHTPPSGISAPPPSGLPPQPPPPPPILAPKPLDPVLDIQGWRTVSLPAGDNVNAAQNQCGPAAYANAFAYLRSTFGLGVPHPHVRGIGGGPSLVGILDLLSNRPVTSTCLGSPIDYCDDGNQGGMFDGLYEYLDLTGLSGAVKLEHQGAIGALPWACDSIAQIGPTSVPSGNVVTIPWIKSHIEKGDAVLLAFNRLAPTLNGEVVTSGHVVRIYGYSEVNGQTYLMALDDQQQDGMVSNVCTLRNNGLTWETWAVGDSDDDGTLNKGLNDLREIVFAMSIGVK